jgi:hypothetical protein
VPFSCGKLRTVTYSRNAGIKRWVNIGNTRICNSATTTCPKKHLSLTLQSASP